MEKQFSLEEAKQIGDQIGIIWDAFTPEILMKGMNVELEHGSHDEQTNVTNNDPIMTAKIAWAHLKERADYYELLEKVEGED